MGIGYLIEKYGEHLPWIVASVICLIGGALFGFYFAYAIFVAP